MTFITVYGYINGNRYEINLLILRDDSLSSCVIIFVLSKQINFIMIGAGGEEEVEGRSDGGFGYSGPEDLRGHKACFG